MDKGAPQSDIFGEYKEALRRAVAEDLVRREAERRIKKGLVALSVEESVAFADAFVARIPLRTRRMRCHSFRSYFGLLKRLGWVESTGEEEFSKVQDRMGFDEEEAQQAQRETGQPRIYYKITTAGRNASEGVIADPLQALYSYPREMRSGKGAPLPPLFFPEPKPAEAPAPKPKPA